MNIHCLQDMLECKIKMTKVLYNQECAVCNFEIKHYKNYTQKQSIDIEFENLHETDLSDWGVDKEQAKKRMHVEKDGKIYSGVDAFIKLWEDMPKYNKLACIAKQPLMYKLGNLLYDNILAPALYNKNKLKERFNGPKS